jgi:hypothetical protein
MLLIFIDNINKKDDFIKSPALGLWQNPHDRLFAYMKETETVKLERGAKTATVFHLDRPAVFWKMVNRP